MDGKMNVIFEDNHIIVAIKPHMLPSQADSSGDADMLSMVKAYVKEKYNKPGNVYIGLVHRLDRPAGGVMVFARTSKAAARLSAQIANKTFKKTYLAVVNGHPAPSGTLTDYLLKNPASNTVKAVAPNTPGAKYAELNYKVLSKTDSLSLLEISLITGRSHQIRVQFASRGFALYGDARYGKGEGDHLALWSSSLCFNHPITKERLCFSAKPHSYPFTAF